MRQRTQLITGSLLFLFVFFTHSISRNSTPFDSSWTIPTILSILNQGDTELHEFLPRMIEHRYYGVECVSADYSVYPAWRYRKACPDGTLMYNHYPTGTTVLALPVFVVMDGALRVSGGWIRAVADPVLTPMMRDFFDRRYLETSAIAEIVIASVFVAMITVLIWLIFRRYLPDWISMLMALLFAFGTPAWSTYSRALYQHGPLALMLALTLYLLTLSERKPGLVSWTAIPLTFGYFIRPTGILPAAAIGAYVLFHHRKFFPKWVVLSGLTAAPFLLYNVVIYHNPIMPYYTCQRWLPFEPRSILRFLEAMAGQLISPNRGLLVFCPFLVFAFWGIYLAYRTHWRTPLTYYLGAVVGLHWLVICTYADWTAGHSYGPRYFSDILVILFYFLIPALLRLRQQSTMRWRLLLVLFAVLSVGIHARGAWDYDVFLWNLQPDINFNRSRGWDWRDPQILHGLF